MPRPWMYIHHQLQLWCGCWGPKQFFMLLQEALNSLSKAFKRFLSLWEDLAHTFMWINTLFTLDRVTQTWDPQGYYLGKTPRACCPGFLRDTPNPEHTLQTQTRAVKSYIHHFASPASIWQRPYCLMRHIQWLQTPQGSIWIYYTYLRNTVTVKGQSSLGLEPKSNALEIPIASSKQSLPASA